MYKWLLPTISELLAAANADIAGSLDPISAVSWDVNVDRERWLYQQSTKEDRRITAQQQWYGAIAAFSRLLQREVATIETENHPLLNKKFAGDLRSHSVNSVLLCSALPVDISANFSQYFEPWRFISEAQLPGDDSMSVRDSVAEQYRQLALPQIVRTLTNDPLSDEQFCVWLTKEFSLVMALGQSPQNEPIFQFSFEPKIVELAVKALRSRVTLTGSPEMASMLDNDLAEFVPLIPDYKTVMLFSQLALKYQADFADFSPKVARATRKPYQLLSGTSGSVVSVSHQEDRFSQKVQQKSLTMPSGDGKTTIKTLKNHSYNATSKHILAKLSATGDKNLRNQTPNQSPSLDVELLQAIAHEVRTPLTTIRTLTRLLLKRRNLDADIIKRLESIDRECSEQIDRFSLIFRAVELETCEKTRSLLQLTSTSLADVFNHCIPRWQKQASRRNLNLEVILPPKMPPVVTDPTMLDQVLTGALENFISSVSGGSDVQVKVMLAGNQLKMQLHSEIKADKWDPSSATTPPLKSIGQLLMFQPETGNISLNLSTTKNLFQALGAKLIVRKRSHQGQVLTIFLPLEA
ncbi:MULTISPECIES: sensor histidine kinase [Planktothricoides]|uniref:histidine kinase n=2 Tax=Planktothricoides raciborskii TaxID=132608 RepID=A0AAU8JDC2_9CYAN|nr:MULTISPECIES: HAMP domain-containing sensor histidine kinase [Planktothricoides]KOR38461.1 hypothetical protein AM228_00115 [Planktothricoides sp. SR001]MBD2544598.1 HAMP domain-containing histidine kinase [Planktothricoides raciborskii FACHB-1370]MBD2583543.1 HAMP domain-containing histidine kinase [Planktothricoides raciborskii FACHB-1261]